MLNPAGYTVPEAKAIIEGETSIQRFARYFLIDNKLYLLADDIVDEIDSLLHALLKILFLYLLHCLVKFMQCARIIADLLAQIGSRFSALIIRQ